MNTNSQQADPTFQEVFDRLVKHEVIRNQTSLAKLLGLGRAAVSWVAAKKGTVPIEWARRFEDAGYSWHWVSTGEGPMFNAHKILAEGRLKVVRKIIGYDDGEVRTSMSDMELPLHKNYMLMIGIRDETDLVYHRVSGDAMSPMIDNDDICLVNINDHDPITGKCYLLKLGVSTIEVRRLLLMGANLVINHSNSVYQNIPFDSDNMTVIGRVAAILKKV